MTANGHPLDDRAVASACKDRILAGNINPTFPLPMHDVTKAVHSLVMCYSLEDLVVMVKRLESVITALTQGAAEPAFELAPPPSGKHRGKKVTDSERGDMLARHARGESIKDIAKEMGRPYPTIAAAIYQSKKGGAEPSR